MKETLRHYVPDQAVDRVFALIKKEGVHLKIVKERKTRHGDYRKLADGQHQITINANLNQYRFLITLVHELAHLTAFKNFGRHIKPHGREWKYTFQHLMLPFITPAIFPKDILPLLARHFKNPKASSDTDAPLAMALKKFDAGPQKDFLFELKKGSLFKTPNGKIFKKDRKRVKRYECIELSTGKIYIFQPHAEVEFLKHVQH